MLTEDLVLAISLAPITLALVPVYYSLAAGISGAFTPPRDPPEGEVEGGISAVVCFVQEGARLEQTVLAFLNASGAHEREVILVGDAPDEDTLAVARDLAADPRVRLFTEERRQGKAFCQERGVRAAGLRHLLFLDARTRVMPEAPRRLALPLAEPDVCYTTGRLRYEGDDGDEGAEGSYWQLEHWIRRHEDASDGILGASGGLFACRRADYVGCPSDAMLDLVIPCVMERLTGGHGRYVETAVAHEPSREGIAAWRRARIRIQARAVGSTGMLRGWLVGSGWRRAGAYLAHKLLRWHLGLSLVLVLVLWSTGSPGMGWIADWVSFLLLLSVSYGLLVSGSRRLSGPATPGYAVYVQLVGWLRAITGNIPRYWSP